LTPRPNHCASHQAPTLIGCLIVKERYCQILYCLILPAATCFAFASPAVSAAEKRDYEEVFIVCQVSIASFASLPCQTFFKILLSLAAIETPG
ncbi:hypothetical protein P3W70_01085, partial [Achromobacter denitrificans]|uniref:hypothetical protein n=1 Tax=Achromobacter denitrificans TaxID=32002 RepID=UPI0023E86F9E